MKGFYANWAVLFTVCSLLPLCVWGGRQMPKLSDKKQCADADCSHPILIARALQDYYPPDCRFIPIHQGQLVYVYAMLKDRGNLFWAGSVQGLYYGDQEARIGHFPSSVVEETYALMPAEVEVKTDRQGCPPFQSEVRWDYTEEAKFRQYGWRCSTHENSYSASTLVGNWSENRLDTNQTKALRRPLPSQYSHYFDTTYSSAYNKAEKRPVYTSIKREPRSYPGHQPELDPPHTKSVANSSYRLDFRGHFDGHGSSNLSPTRERD